MSNDDNPNLLERIIRVEGLDPFPNRSRDKVTVKALGEKNGQLHYELTITRQGVIAATEQAS
ncbi:MAG: hypothetical protein ACYCZX_07720 [Rhodospirillaceae bacterium]